MPNITPYPGHQENSAARAGRCSTQQNSHHARTSRRNSRHLHALPSSANEAARVIEQAPLFCWNGIKDATGKKLQPAYYSEGAVTDSEKAIFIHATGGTSFSPQVLNCFKAIETSYLMGGYSRCDRIHVHPFHPLYSHVKAAAKASVVKEEKLFAAQRAKREKLAA
ncbi:hypothetical protein [Xylella fastidiosa]|nr:hypothetical protein [Xylella fastidiosa]ERI59268.1 hypothetical protein M233_10535 [Xylella fastidiosa subsp. multiplex Griffin-1]KAJ4852208.1 hypothetical protein XYFPCFBP8418_010045 [Xylella fastidiosa subsp. multiplex]MDC6414060.1 hypothetical protein [Xylella fastidiosa subsp. multiplex]MDC6414946.1 hypothetical protein [Xylella fastidiosa subsp. multiplex]MDD0870902.1 hypothetical protein [Xylella fastidiosa subsp. multiplex]